MLTCGHIFLAPQHPQKELLKADAERLQRVMDRRGLTKTPSGNFVKLDSADSADTKAENGQKTGAAAETAAPEPAEKRKKAE